MDAFYVGAQIEIRPPVPAHMLAGTRYLPDDMDDTDSEVVVVIDHSDYSDHSRIVPRADNRQTNRPEAIVGDVQGLVDFLGPGYAYRGQLRIDDATGEPPSRVRVVADGERRTAIREDADYVYAADYLVPAGPAAVFDLGAARTWLAVPGDDGLSRGQADFNIDTDSVYDPTEHSPADWVERMLHHLAGEHPAAPHMWRTAPGVAVEVVETIGPEGYADGGAVLVVQVGGLRVASRWLDWKDLAGAEYGQDGQPTRPQLDAAVEALEVTARTVNQVVEQHRMVRAADAATKATLTTIPSLAGKLSLADVECALRTLADLWNGADLGDAGDPRDVLSSRQRQVAETVCALVAADHEKDHTDATPSRTDDR
jgi:hypothetical protein